MQVTKLGKFTLTCKPEHTADYLILAAKAIKTRKPTVRGGVKRLYPAYGEHLSTRDYVIQYHSLNGKTVLSNFYDMDNLAERITPHEGMFTLEIEA